MNDTQIETLMAYADGELDEAQALEVETLLASNAEARAMVARFRQTRADLAPGLDTVLREAVPQRLIDTVRHHPMGGKPATTDAPPLTPMGVDLLRVDHPATAANTPSYWPRMAAAACLAMAVGLTTGHWWGQQSDAGSDVAQVLQRALQNLSSGETLSEGGVQVLPIASFRAADGQACREFEQEAQGRLVHGVACRVENQWVSRVVLDRGPVNGSLGEVPAFAPASGEADALATLLDRLGAGPVLGAAEERQLIESGWGASR
ncbi:MAG: hypothetical protein C0453_03725 [Comamonadaceae bacterium]|nr:hypothetical protein [Comamonadaceae bacterium]